VTEERSKKGDSERVEVYRASEKSNGQDGTEKLGFQLETRSQAGMRKIWLSDRMAKSRVGLETPFQDVDTPEGDEGIHLEDPPNDHRREVERLAASSDGIGRWRSLGKTLTRFDWRGRDFGEEPSSGASLHPENSPSQLEKCSSPAAPEGSNHLPRQWWLGRASAMRMPPRLPRYLTIREYLVPD
jgi:hypothetical protein